MEETEIITSLDSFMLCFLVLVEVLSAEASTRYYQRDFPIKIKK